MTDDSLVQCISDIRAALGDAGHELLRTVPRRGYLLDLPPAVATVNPSPAPQDAPDPLPDPVLATDLAPPSVAYAKPVSDAPTVTPFVMPPAGPGGSHLTGPVSLGVLCLLGLLAVAAVLAVGHWRDNAPAERSPAIAVLPFVSQGGDDAALGMSMAEDLTADLARNVDLHVISPRSSFVAAAQGGDAVAMAARLHARYLIDGRVRAEAQLLQLSVQLVDGANGRLIWTDQSRLAAAQLPASREALLQRIAGTLRASMASDQKRSALAAAPASLDSYNSTLRALGLKHRMLPDATRAARALLARVLQQEPGYAPALAVHGYVDALDAGLRLTGELGPPQMDDAIASLRRSIALDSEQPLAWQGLAVALTFTPQRAEALPAADRALQLAPGDAENRVFRALARLYANRYEEALQQVREAQGVYPIAPPYADGIVALVLSANGRWGETLEVAQACLQKAPQFPTCRANRMFALAALGRIDEARVDMAAMASSKYLATNQLTGSAEAERRRLMAVLSAAPMRAPGGTGGTRPMACSTGAAVQ